MHLKWFPSLTMALARVNSTLSITIFLIKGSSFTFFSQITNLLAFSLSSQVYEIFAILSHLQSICQSVESWTSLYL